VTELFAAIARLKRQMPRNADAMAICDALEATLVRPAPTVAPRNVTLCPACEARRLQNVARQKQLP